MTSIQRAALRQALVRDQGLRLAAYPDHLGFLTIGIGRLIDPRKPGAGISHDEAYVLCDNDIRQALSDLHGFTWFGRLDAVRQNALLNMRFQLGPSGFRSFRKMIAALSAGDVQTASEEGLDSVWATIQTPSRARRVMHELASGHGG